VKSKKFPIMIDIDVTDDTAIEEAASYLETTPETLRLTINFAHEVFALAESRKITKGQLTSALLSVVGILVRESGEEEDRRELCMRMFEGMWATAGLTAKPWFVGSPPKGQVH
tara:strand:+ start:560 stop:898 length:339 start_codon:yes stop_codon:yes gene_type:complete